MGPLYILHWTLGQNVGADGVIQTVRRARGAREPHEWPTALWTAGKYELESMFVIDKLVDEGVLVALSRAGQVHGLGLGFGAHLAAADAYVESMEQSNKLLARGVTETDVRMRKLRALATRIRRVYGGYILMAEARKKGDKRDVYLAGYEEFVPSGDGQAFVTVPAFQLPPLSFADVSQLFGLSQAAGDIATAEAARYGDRQA